MILTVNFNFTPSDKRDPQSQPDCELLDIQLDGVTVPLRIENDLAINRHLLAVIYRIYQLSETK